VRVPGASLSLLMKSWFSRGRLAARSCFALLLRSFRSVIGSMECAGFVLANRSPSVLRRCYRSYCFTQTEFLYEMAV
jgi:hypothetical protein